MTPPSPTEAERIAYWRERIDKIKTLLVELSMEPVPRLHFDNLVRHRASIEGSVAVIRRLLTLAEQAEEERRGHHP